MPKQKQASHTDVKDIQSTLPLTFEQELSIRAVSKRLKISKTTVRRICYAQRKAGLRLSPTSGPGRGRRSRASIIRAKGTAATRYRRAEMAEDGERAEARLRHAPFAMAGIPGRSSGWLWLYMVLRPVCQA